MCPDRGCTQSQPSLLCVEELRKQEETGQLVQPVLFVLLVLVSVLLYFAVSLMDPGFILSDDSDLQVNADRNVCFCPSRIIANLCQNACMSLRSRRNCERVE